MEQAVANRSGGRFSGFAKRYSSGLEKSVTVREIIFVAIAAGSLFPWCSPPVALLLGLLLAQFIGHPYRQFNHRITSFLLKASVIGLGFGIDFNSAVQAGREGFLFTIVSIVITLLLGVVAGKALGIERKTAYLIASGTAICGGSAIAAIAPVIDAEERHTSVALGTVFVLNAVALLVFPVIGTWLHMTQHQFGMWAAIAIHDTSSVVGAAGKYGEEALRIATTVKLARSLWIIPLAIATAFRFRQNVSQVKVPWFIALFIAAMLVRSYLPVLHPLTSALVPAAHAGLTLTLFLIGAGLSADTLRQVGWQALVQGVVTWIAISVITLAVVLRMA